MDTLKDTLAQVLKGYAGEIGNGKIYLTSTPDQSIWTTIAIARVQKKQITTVTLVVRLVDDLVIIDHDNNDKPLVDALVQAGITRDHIVLAYAGESLPTTAVAASSG
ncbi:MAG: XisI protein [Anaerolineae bacterium]|nr:XisI protein [Anaerolineae bacterium]